MTTSTSPEQQELLELIGDAETRLKDLQHELAVVDEQVTAFSGERQQYELLNDICLSLDKLGEMGAASLFWGEQVAAEEPETNLARARNSVVEFQKRYSGVEESQQTLQKRVNEQLTQIEYLHEDLTLLREREDRAQFDFTIEREARELPYRPMVMPWTRQGEDEKRFRKSLALVLLFVFFLGSLINFWELPEVDKDAVVEIPEHLVKMVEKQKPKPKPPEKRPEEKPKEKSDEKKPDEKKPQPTKAETQQARQKAQTSGVLAFKDEFNDLLADDVDAKLGTSARLSNRGAVSSNNSSRDLVMSQATSSSGGINTASLNRNVGGTASKLGGVSFSRVDSAIGTDYADDRPLSDGPGPSRTDEEIQIVFDRYKAALYRIYNRELRKNPSLKGKMVLRITIEPDGSVSMAKVESSDMDSPELSANIIERVNRFNFGPKDGVPKTTILYPIDFLPAS